MTSIRIDTSRLTFTQFLVDSAFIDGANTATVNMEPGEYGFQQPGVLANFKFRVTADGMIDYDAAYNGFLSGRGTATLTIQGFKVTLNATALSHDLQLNGVGNILSRNLTHELTLVPAQYVFQPLVGIQADFQFDLDLNGQVVIDQQRYGGFAIANGQTLTLNGYRIMIDGRQLSHDLGLFLNGNQDILPRNLTHEITLLPGTGYFFQSTPQISADFRFDLDVNGQVVIDPRYAGFAVANGQILALNGYKITLDGRQLSHDLGLFLNGNGDVLSRDRTHEITLLPAAVDNPATGYFLQPSPQIMSDFRFGVDGNGQVIIHPHYAGFAVANGQTLALNGYKITLDGRQLSHDLGLFLNGNDDVLSGDSTHELTLIPGAGYLLEPAPGVFANFQFTLNVNGQMEIDPQYAGFAAVNGQTLTTGGYRITIDARQLSHDLGLFLNGNSDVLSRDSTHEVTLIPAAGYSFQGVPEIASDFRFDLDVNGQVGIAPRFADFVHVEGRTLTFGTKQKGMFAPSIFSSLTQSDFGIRKHGNFEAVIRSGKDLLHYWRDNTNDDDQHDNREWKLDKTFGLDNVAGAGAIIQSDFKTGDNGNFEVVVPLQATPDRVELWHFFKDNANIDNQWIKFKRITKEFDQVVGSASLIQSDFKRGDHGNFEVVVPLMGPHGHAELWHFYHDNANVDSEWVKMKRITREFDQVVGPGSITQSDFKTGEHGNFEVVVPLMGPHGHAELWHFYHDNANVDSEWVKMKRITNEWDHVAGPGSIIQSDFGDRNHNHNLEVIVPLQMPYGQIELWHFLRETDVNSEWRRGKMITSSVSASGGSCLIRSDYGPDDHDNFEVLVEECKQSIVHYWHDNADVNTPWIRGRVLRDAQYLTGEKESYWVSNTKKIIQLTGEYDREGWDGHGTPGLAHNQTQTRFGIYGTDLGVSFTHKERIYFLFGDTLREPHPTDNLDSIAFSTVSAVGYAHIL